MKLSFSRLVYFSDFQSIQPLHFLQSLQFLRSLQSLKIHFVQIFSKNDTRDVCSTDDFLNFRQILTFWLLILLIHFFLWTCLSLDLTFSVLDFLWTWPFLCLLLCLLLCHAYYCAYYYAYNYAYYCAYYYAYYSLTWLFYAHYYAYYYVYQYAYWVFFSLCLDWMDGNGMGMEISVWGDSMSTALRC